jgi:hypothetical protein
MRARGGDGGPPPSAVSPLLSASAGLLMAVLALSAVGPSLQERALELARHGFAAATPVAVVGRQAVVLLALALAPLLLGAAAAGAALWLQSTAMGRGPARTSVDTGRRPQGLSRALAIVLLVVAAVVLSLRREPGGLASLREQPAALAASSAVAMARRLVLRTGLLLLAAGVVEHVLLRLRRQAALLPARGGADSGEGPRLGREVRRRGIESAPLSDDNPAP